jgi:hypothetical protein
MNKLSKRAVLYVISLFSLVAFYWMFLIILNFAPQFSGLPYAMTKAMLGVITLRAIDDFILPEVDTLRLMRRNPIGYAIYIFGYAVVIGWALSAA